MSGVASTACTISAGASVASQVSSPAPKFLSDENLMASPTSPVGSFAANANPGVTVSSISDNQSLLVSIGYISTSMAGTVLPSRATSVVPGSIQPVNSIALSAATAVQTQVSSALSCSNAIAGIDFITSALIQSARSCASSNTNSTSDDGLSAVSSPQTFPSTIPSTVSAIINHGAVTRASFQILTSSVLGNIDGISVVDVAHDPTENVDSSILSNAPAITSSAAITGASIKSFASGVQGSMDASTSTGTSRSVILQDVILSALGSVYSAATLGQIADSSIQILASIVVSDIKSISSLASLILTADTFHQGLLPSVVSDAKSINRNVLTTSVEGQGLVSIIVSDVTQSGAILPVGVDPSNLISSVVNQTTLASTRALVPQTTPIGNIAVSYFNQAPGATFSVAGSISSVVGVPKIVEENPVVGRNFRVAALSEKLQAQLTMSTPNSNDNSDIMTYITGDTTHAKIITHITRTVTIIGPSSGPLPTDEVYGSI
jgi:hypothetical protein